MASFFGRKCSADLFCQAVGISLLIFLGAVDCCSELIKEAGVHDETRYISDA